MNWRRVIRTFVSGLIVVLPIFVTAALIWWVLATIEAMLGAATRLFIPDEAYRRGMGIALAIALVFATGLLSDAVLFRRLLATLQRGLDRVPLVKTIHGALRDLMSIASRRDSQKFSRVVLLSVPGVPVRVVGFVTMEDFADVALDFGKEIVGVYVPMSYQIGGFTFFVPRELLTPVEMTIADAMRLVVTAGMSAAPAAAPKT